MTSSKESNVTRTNSVSTSSKMLNRSLCSYGNPDYFLFKMDSEAIEELFFEILCFYLAGKFFDLTGSFFMFLYSFILLSYLISYIAFFVSFAFYLKDA